MSTVASSTPTTSDVFASLTGSKTGTTDMKDTEDRFLRLLVAQLQNQDPLNPMDNAQMTSQLAQINTVGGIDKLNKSMTSLKEVYDNTQAMQAAGMIGRHALIAGSNLPLNEGQAAGGVLLDAPADSVKVSIFDAKGVLMQTENLGGKAAGSFTFVWDGEKATGGTAPDGKYTFKVEATRGTDTVKVSPLQVGMINAVVRGKEGFTLDLGSAGSVAFKDVQQLL